LALPWQVGCEFVAASRRLATVGFAEAQAWAALAVMATLADVILLPQGSHEVLHGAYPSRAAPARPPRGVSRQRSAGQAGPGISRPSRWVHCSVAGLSPKSDSSSGNFLSRIGRDQLLAVARETLGEPWAQSRARDNKASLVGQLERAFASPDRPGQTPEQAEKLKNWLPAGMAFGPVATSKPAKGKKSRKAA
jgi:hypothetical protein